MSAAAKDKRRRWQGLDFYGALDLCSNASQAEVKRGFRKVALTCHPDKVPEAEREAATQRFQLIAEAYEVLSDAKTRAEYDDVRRRVAGPFDGARFDDLFRPAYRRQGSDRAAEAARNPGSEAATPSRQPYPQSKMPQASDPSRRRGFPFGGFGFEESCHACGNRCPGVDMFPVGTALVCPRCRRAGIQPKQRPSAPQEQQQTRSQQPAASSPQRLQQRPQPEPQSRPAPPAPPAAPVPAGREPTANRTSSPREHVKDVKRTASDACARRPSEPSPPQAPSDGDNDTEEGEDILLMRDILLAMGFDPAATESAIKRCSSIEAAVEFLMQQFKTPSKQSAADRQKAKAELHAVAEEPLMTSHPSCSSATGQLPVEVWARGLSAEPKLSTRTPQPAAAPPEAIAAKAASQDLKETLLSLGFSQADVDAASIRCSSVEAAVEFLTLRCGQQKGQSVESFGEGSSGSAGSDAYPAVGSFLRTSLVAVPAVPGTALGAIPVPPTAAYCAGGPSGPAPSPAPAAASVPRTAFQPAFPGHPGDADDCWEAANAMVRTRSVQTDIGFEEALSDRAAKIVAGLAALGFNPAQSREAAKRCSSLEAAVEWIMAHPDAGGPV